MKPIQNGNRINNAGIVTQTFKVNQNKQLLLQTSDVIILSSMKTKKMLLDSSSQRTNIPDLARKCLSLETQAIENLSIFLIFSKNVKNKNVAKVKFLLANLNELSNAISLTAMSIRYICSPINYEEVNFARRNYVHFQNFYEID